MTDSTAEPELPLGTTKETARLHRNIQRVCWVLLIGLVVEGALILPFTMIWYGFPTLSVTEICSELEKAQYADDARECELEPLGVPFVGGEPANSGREVPNEWGPLPEPLYDPLGFRELVEIHEARERDGAG